MEYEVKIDENSVENTLFKFTTTNNNTNVEKNFQIITDETLEEYELKIEPNISYIEFVGEEVCGVLKNLSNDVDYEGYYKESDGKFYHNYDSSTETYSNVFSSSELKDGKFYWNITDSSTSTHKYNFVYKYDSTNTCFNRLDSLSIYLISAITENKIIKRLPYSIIINATSLDGKTIWEDSDSSDDSLMLKEKVTLNYVSRTNAEELFDELLENVYELKQQVLKYEELYQYYFNIYYQKYEEINNTLTTTITNLINKNNEVKGKL